MTQHVRTNYRKHRKATWAVVLLVALVGALIAAVIPATGATGDPTGLKSDPLGVQPIENPNGGNTYNCPGGYKQFKINNPKSGTFSTTVDGLPVSFTLVVSGGGNATKDKYLSFKSNIAAVSIVAINGGTKTAVYTYGDSSPAIADGYGSGTTVDVDATNGKIGLHAPVDSTGAPFSLSYTTFCFKLPTVTPTCDRPFSGVAFFGTGGTATYTAQLVPQEGRPCKSNQVVMYSYTPGQNQLFATLHPPTQGGNDPWEVVEHIEWTGITLDKQNPITLWYDDQPPYDGSHKADLAPCNSDPRSDPDDFELPADHDGLLPNTNPATTSCLLSSTDSAGSGPDDRHFDAWIYSNVDGTRGH